MTTTGTDVRSVLHRERLLAILRYHAGGDLDRVLAALRRGGVRVAEITTDTPGALDAVSRAAGQGHLMGLGTVTSVAQVRDCLAAGGSFVVSPGLDADVVRAALDAGLEPVPGVTTATEVLAALRAGARLLKLFPAGPLGADYLSALRGPFSNVEFVTTGGIGTADVVPLLRAGAVAVGLGSALVGGQPPADDAAADALARQAADVVASVRAVDGRQS